MKVIKTGTTRLVIIAFNFVFKIPSPRSYKSFLLGLMCNIQEKEFSAIEEMRHKVCPVLFYFPLGLFIVMPKARVLIKGELSRSYLQNFCENDDYIIPAEPKHDSFGYLNGNLVAIDYGS